MLAVRVRSHWLAGRVRVQALEAATDVRLGIEQEHRGGHHLVPFAHALENRDALAALPADAHGSRHKTSGAERAHDAIAAAGANDRVTRHSDDLRSIAGVECRPHAHPRAYRAAWIVEHRTRLDGA